MKAARERIAWAFVWNFQSFLIFGWKKSQIGKPRPEPGLSESLGQDHSRWGQWHSGQPGTSDFLPFWYHLKVESVPKATLEMHQGWWVIFIALFASFQPLCIAGSDSSFCPVSEIRSFSSFGTRTRSHLPARWVKSEPGFAASSCWELDAPLATPATWLASKWSPCGATWPHWVPQLPLISGVDTGSYRDHPLAAPEKGRCSLTFPINWIN